MKFYTTGKGKKNGRRIIATVICLAVTIATIPKGGSSVWSWFAPRQVLATVSDEQERKFANVVLFAHFAGAEAQEDQAFFANPENRNKIINFYDGPQKRSMKNYLKTISYGKFNVVNIFPQDNGMSINSFELPYDKNAAYNSNIDYGIIQTLMANIPELSNQIVDYDGDGYVDNLTIIIRGGNKQAGNQASFTSHKSDYYENDVVWTGKKIGTYNMVNTYTLMESGVAASESALITHEFLHSLGYPDLYPASGDAKPVHVWDIMATTNIGMTFPLAYLRMYYSHWLDIETITATTTLTLDLQTTANGNQAYILKSPLNDNELFVVEFRKRGDMRDPDSLERHIGGDGIIVYRVDTTVTGLSNHHGQTAIYVFRPGGENGDVNQAFLSVESGRTSIGTSDMSAGMNEGALTFSDGTNSGIVISEVSSSAGNQMTCKVTIPEASQFDLWEETSLNDLTADYGTKDSAIGIYGGKPILMTSSNNLINVQEYDNGIWNTMLSGWDLGCGRIDNLQLSSLGDRLFLSFVGTASTTSTLYIREWNGSSFVQYASIEGITYEYAIKEYNGSLYAAVDTLNEQKMRLLRVDGTNVQDLGAYYTAEQGKYCGNPNICVMGDKLILSVRNSSESDRIYIYTYHNGTFSSIDSNLYAATYDMIALEQKLYVTLGTTGNENIKLHIYDEANGWHTVTSDYNKGFPMLQVSQGNLYIMACDAEAAISKTSIYTFDKNTEAIVKEGEDVDSSSTPMGMVSIGKTIYVALLKTVNGINKNVVRMKDTVNQLTSITITPPLKTTYEVGGNLDLTGMRVMANYVRGSVEIAPGNVSISGFDSSSEGMRNLTVTYQGVSNTVSYTIVKKASDVPSAPVTPPQPTTTIQITLPSGYNDSCIYIDGEKKQATLLNGTLTVDLGRNNAKTAVLYQYNDKGVPVGMYCYTLDYQDGKYVVTAQPELENLLSYHGFSIRVTGKAGIRFKSGIDEETRKKLLSGGINGYKLVEYGTIYMTASNMDTYPMIVDGEKTGKGRAYWKENGKINDKVLERVDGRCRFASVLVGIPASKYNENLAFRSYIILEREGQQVIFYGPVVTRSIYTVAKQLESGNYFKPGSSGYKYIKNIISTVEGK